MTAVRVSAYLIGIQENVVFRGKEKDYTVTPLCVTDRKGQPLPLDKLRKYQNAKLTVTEASVLNAMIYEQDELPLCYERIVPVEVAEMSRDFQAVRVVYSKDVYDAVLVGYVEWMVTENRWNRSENIGQVEGIERELLRNGVQRWTVEEFDKMGSGHNWTSLRAYVSSMHSSQGSFNFSDSGRIMHAASLFHVSLTLHHSKGHTEVCQMSPDRPHIHLYPADQVHFLLYSSEEIRMLSFDLWTRLPSEWNLYFPILLELLTEVGNWIRIKHQRFFQWLFRCTESMNLYTRLSSIIPDPVTKRKLCSSTGLCSSCHSHSASYYPACGCSLCPACTSKLPFSRHIHECGIEINTQNVHLCQSCNSDSGLIPTNCECKICFQCAIRFNSTSVCFLCNSALTSDAVRKLARYSQLKTAYSLCARCQLFLYQDQSKTRLKCRHFVHTSHIGKRTQLFCSFCHALVSA